MVYIYKIVFLILNYAKIYNMNVHFITCYILQLITKTYLPNSVNVFKILVKVNTIDNILFTCSYKYFLLLDINMALC